MKFNVERKITINTQQDQLKPLITDLTNWPKWSPWLCLEPGCEPGYSNNNQTMSWKGDVIGEGSLSIDRIETQSIHFNLNFIAPFKSTAKTAFYWAESGEQTEVKWVMDSSLPIFLFFLIPMMKGLITMDYRRGLRRLKAIAEVGNVDCELDWQGDTKAQPAFHFVGLSMKDVAFDNIDSAIGPLFEEVVESLPQRKNSALVCLDDGAKLSKDTMSLSIGMAYYDEAPELPPGNWVTREIPAHNSVKVAHKGPYDFLGDAWAMLMMTTRAKKMKAHKKVPAYEKYIVCSAHTDDASQFETEIHFPVKG